MFLKIIKSLKPYISIILHYINIVVTKRFNGKKFRIPVIYTLGAYNLISNEPWMTGLLTELLKIKRGIFVDIGVNVGQTLIKLKSVDQSVKYLGFEPNPACVFYVNNLVKLNKFTDCTILPVGLSNCSGVVKLLSLSDDPSDSCASIIENFRPDSAVKVKQYVPVFKIDDLGKGVVGNDRIGIVKIDVEGAELEVLESIKNILSLHEPVVLVEILPAYTENNVMRIDRQKALEQLLSGLNYALYLVIKSSKGEFTGIRRIQEIGVHADLSRCDYVLLPLHMQEALPFEQS